VEGRDFGVGGVTRCRDFSESVKRGELGNCGCGKLRERTEFTTEDTEFTEEQGGKSRAKGLPWEAWVKPMRRSAINNIHYYNMDVNGDCGTVRIGRIRDVRAAESASYTVEGPKNIPRFPGEIEGHPEFIEDLSLCHPAGMIRRRRYTIMDHKDAFDAVRLVFHSDIPDALLRDVIEKAIKNHREEMDSRRESKTAKGAGAETPREDLQSRKKG